MENLKKYLEILKKCPLFAEIAEENLLRMLSCLGAKILSFDKRETVFPEGTQAKYIGLVLSGEIQVVQVDYYGNRSIFSNLRTGEVFGEAFACAEVGALPVSILASERSDVMLIECAHILHTCENNCGFHGRLIYNLMKDLAQKTLAFHERIEVTSKRTTREKLLSYLAIEARHAGEREFSIPFDRQELADYLEVDRSGLSAEISKLRAEGVLDCQKNRFVLLAR
jgi:CRP-like cAMP-binding protein